MRSRRTVTRFAGLFSADTPQAAPATATGLEALRDKVRKAVALFDDLFGGARRKLNSLAFRAQDIERRYGIASPISAEVWKRTLALRHRWNAIRNPDAEDKARALEETKAKGGVVQAQYRPLLDGLDPETGRITDTDTNESPFLGQAQAAPAVAVTTLITIAIGLLLAGFLTYWVGRIADRWSQTRALVAETDTSLALFNRLLEAGVTQSQAADILGIVLGRSTKTGPQDWITWAIVGGGVLATALLLRRHARA